MKLDFNAYKDKVYACWLGKNMGGTIGAPYEGKREVLDIKGFATKKGEVLPNDDLDLQLVWLHAVEFEGPRNITSEVLGEYWLSFITGYWNEYGIARRNMEKGVMPPLCGDLQNPWKHSNGAWIRTEIWATLAPAYPDLAVRFSVEDAKVDHGFGEGTYSAAFVAALESAAFVVSDLKKLIKIGLAKIPEDCRTAKTVKFVLESYEKGVNPVETRNAVQKMNAVTVELGNSFECDDKEIEKFLLPYGKCEETDPMRASLFTLKENTLQKKVGSITAIVSCKEGFVISAGQEKTLEIRILNNVKAYGNLPHTVRVKLWLPEGMTADKTEFDIFAPHWTPFTLNCISEIKEVKLKAETLPKAI